MTSHNSLNPEVVKNYFIQAGFTPLSDYVNWDTPIKCLCPKGHKRSTTFSNLKKAIKKGTRGCQQCGDEARSQRENSQALEEARALFAAEGYTLLSTEYKAKKPLDFICPNGHKHSIPLIGFKQGARCALCVGNARKKLSEVKQAFEDRGFNLLSDSYKNVNTKLEAICPQGHKVKVSFLSFNKNTKYGCAKCQAAANSGLNSANYNINLTAEDRAKRDYNPANKKWSKDVLEAFNFTCYSCGDDRGGNLHAHHLWSYADNPELRLDLDNGVCLCNKCHTEFHNHYGYGENNPNQIEEYLGQFSLID